MADRVNRSSRTGVTTTSRPKAASDAAMRKTARPSSAQTRSRQELGITEDQVRNRAYQIFLRRNGAPGDPFGDWVLAECELVNEVRC